jgi:ribose/xylose/arabinose/galactoside ABC-type transport system permease subunit
MMAKIRRYLVEYRRFVPMAATALLAIVAYSSGAVLYRGMRDPQVFLNLFITTPFLLISAVGMTFVILTGGIDLSVSGVVALTTVAAAALLREGWNAWLVVLAMLVMGTLLGAVMGGFITYLKVQPFIATLAGMWFARGLCFFISDDAIQINNRIYDLLGDTKFLIPLLADPVEQTGAYISPLAVVAMLVLVVGTYVAHRTRFGRTVYAIGGSEQSALLMGLPVNRTKVLVYALSGFCSALAGITLSIYVSSGHGSYARGFELDVIAVVVMAGTSLAGGQGYVFGALFGVLVTDVIQTLIQFHGDISSWWTRIVVGALTLIVIGIQSQLAARSGRGGDRNGAKERVQSEAARRRRRLTVAGVAGGVAVVALAAVLIASLGGNGTGDGTPTAGIPACDFESTRQDEAASLVAGGAVIAYERKGGEDCIHELYAIYPDGRMVLDDGSQQLEVHVTAGEVDQLLSTISARRWFTDEMYDTWHTPCGQCFTYYTTVVYQGQEKTVKAVDGGTDAPADYWQVVSAINGVLAAFDSGE